MVKFKEEVKRVAFVFMTNGSDLLIKNVRCAGYNEYKDSLLVQTCDKGTYLIPLADIDWWELKSEVFNNRIKDEEKLEA